MKKIWLWVLAVIVGAFFVLSRSNFHVKRNTHNLLPVGMLTPSGDVLYKDEVDRIWELQPQIRNKFHQPPGPVPPVPIPYPNVVGSLEFDSHNPNWKLLSKVEEGGGSYEAILQPEGTYLTTGPRQGTYNYGHPTGLWGNIKHVLLDVIPHLLNGTYQN